MTATSTESRGSVLASRLGIKILGREGHDLRAACIGCQSSDGLRIHQDTGVAHCYVCQGSWSRLQLATAALGDQQQAWRVLEDVGFEEPRSNGSHKAPPANVLEIIAREKSVSPEALRAFGATAEGRTVRFPVYGSDGQQCSSFTLKPGNGKGLFEKDKPSGLFFPGRLPKPGERWLLTEGVKDAAALHELGFNAAGLSSCKLNSKYIRLFSDTDATIIPDRDRPGEDGAAEGAAKLYRVARSVRVASLPVEFKETKGADVRDVLKLPNGRELLLQAIQDAKLWGDAPATGANGLPSVARDEGRTELVNAKRFVAMHGGTVRYCDLWGKWLAWDGRRWRIDETREIDAKAKDVFRAVWAEALQGQIDRDIQRFATASGSARGINAFLALAKSEPGIPVRPNDLDGNPWLLNVNNGTLDLKTGKLRPHDPADMITKLCPIDYDADAGTYLWDSTLKKIFEYKARLIQYVQRFAGYCLTGDVSEQVLPIWWGSGSNGKSLILGIILEMLGADYAMKAPPDFLVAKGETHPTERADLFGKRLVVAIETDDGKRLAESLVKDLSGGDRQRARRMREDFWEFNPTHKLILATNHKPTVRGTDHAIWRRLALVPFAVTFWNADKDDPGPEDLRADKRLPEKLRAELPGILAWAVAGCLAWQQEGLGQPDEVKEATAGYRCEQDVIGQFLADCCVVDRAAKCKAGDLYAAYKKWADQAGEFVVNQRRFGLAVTDRRLEGFERFKNNGTWYKGIDLATD